VTEAGHDLREQLETLTPLVRDQDTQVLGLELRHARLDETSVD
jgi:hypothetical protein